MVEKLRITQESEQSEEEIWVVLRVHGEPRAHNVEPLATMLEPMVSVACCRVRVRFENAKGVDSSTLGLLASARSQAERGSGRLCLQFSERLGRDIKKLLGLGEDDDWTSEAPARFPKPPRPRPGGQARRERDAS